MMCPRGGYAHASTSSVQRRVQGAGGPRSPQWSEAGSRGLSRALAEARSAQSVESRLCDASGQCISRRRAEPARRATHRRVGTVGGAADAGVGSRKKSCAALSREQRLQVSAQLRGAYPLAVVCRVVDAPRSSVYARQHAVAKAADVEVGRRIERIAGQWPTYGYRRVTAQLRWEGVRVNGKRVRGVMSA